MLNRILVGCLVGLSLASCANETPEPDVSAFRQLNEQLVAEVDAHEANVTAMTDMTGCASERDRYGAAADPIVAQMQDLSAGMDDCMMAMGSDALADMQQTCGAMGDELATYMEAACASSNRSEARAETERHSDAMRQLARQEMARADTMMQGHDKVSWKMVGRMCGD